MTQRITLRLEDGLHARVVAAAERDRRSVNSEIEWALDFVFGAPRGKEVHRKDGDPLNNDPGNLELRERPS